MGDTTLATFRIDKDTWESFKEWASDRGSNASTELNQFILRALGRIDRNLDTNIDGLGTRIDKDIDKRIDVYLDSNLDARIADGVKKYLDKHLYNCIDKALPTHLDKNIENLDNCIDKNLDNTVNKNIDDNLDTCIDKNSSEDSLQGGLNDNQVSEVIEETDPLETAKSEDVPECEEDKNPKLHSQQEIEDDEGKAAKQKKQGKNAKTRLTQEELDHAIAVKDLKTLLELPLTGKGGKRDIVKILSRDDSNSWIKDEYKQFKQETGKKSFSYANLNTQQADQIIRKYCQK